MNTTSAHGELLSRFRRQPRASYLEIRGWSDVEPRDMQDDVRLLLCWHDRATEWLTQSDTPGRSVATLPDDHEESEPPVATRGDGVARGPAAEAALERQPIYAPLASHRASAVRLVEAFLASPADASFPPLSPHAPLWVRRLYVLMDHLQETVRAEGARHTSLELRHEQRSPTTALRALRRVPLIQPGFVDGLGFVSADQVTQALLASMRAGAEGWRPTDEGLPVFPYIRGGGTAQAAVLDVFVQPPEGTPLSDGLTTTMWHMVEELSDLDTDILNVLQAHILRYRDADGFAWITAQAILDDRDMLPITKREGHDRRAAGHRTEDLAEVAASMARLQHMYVRISTMAHGRGQLAHLDSRVLDVDLHGSDQRSPMAWHFTIPFLTRLFLQPPTNFEAVMLQPVVRYHRKNNRREKRIGDYCLRQFRLGLAKALPTLSPTVTRGLHERFGERRPLVVVRVLRDIFAELALFVDERNPERTRSQFEATMRDLIEKEIVGAWGYCDDLPLPPRRWLERWLGQSIWIASTERIRDYYAHALPAGRHTPHGSRTLPRGSGSH